MYVPVILGFHPFFVRFISESSISAMFVELIKIQETLLFSCGVRKELYSKL